MAGYAIRGLSKSYNGIPVFQNVNLEWKEDGIYCLTAPSGAGKTTFLRVLMGLEKPDAGISEGLKERRIGAVFQEDRLCLGLDAAANILLTDPVCRGEELRQELRVLLPQEGLNKPVSEYSGGMRRRVSLLRALLSRGEVLLFDEPFNGLDTESRRLAIEYVRKKRAGRMLLFTTHHEEEAEALGACMLRWDEGKRTWLQEGRH